MAVQHPVAGIVGDELYITCLSNTDEHSISGRPRCLWLSPTFATRNYKRVPMQMDRMVIHAQVDHANSHTVAQPHKQRRSRRSSFAIESEPVEFHVHGVRSRIARQNGVLLQQDHEVAINRRIVRLLWVHDEGAQHADHFLHSQVRVIKVGAFLMKREFIDKSAAWLDRVLARSWCPVHVVRDFKSMPVHRERLRQMVINNDPNPVALIYLNRWPGSAAIESPQVRHFARYQLLFHRLGNEMELLNISLHAPGKPR